MIISIDCSVLSGYQGIPVQIELDISRGFPSILFVGLADTMIKESKERVRVALENNGFHMPHQKVTVNFVPADVKKIGSHLDLAIAIALAGAMSLEEKKSKNAQSIGVFGELGLNGAVIEVKEIIPLLISLVQRGIKKFIIPQGNVKAAKLLKGIEVMGVSHVCEAIFQYFCCDSCDIRNLLKENPELAKYQRDVKWTHCGGYYQKMENVSEDFSQVLGQKMARRGCEIAVAGMHNLLMMGSPGCGKSMIAKRMIGIMPPLEYEEVMELTKIYSISNIKVEGSIVSQRPFRSPNSGISAIGLCGGGNPVKPGEISLAHRGILFLDELLEFKRNAIESLRQPMEDGKISIVRANESVELPCELLLVGALNPCPCGYLFDEKKNCTCQPYEIRRYLSKLSGPMLDRFDMQIHLKRVEYEELRSDKKAEDSKSILRRVEAAREIQKKRFESKIKLNSNMSVRDLKHYCHLDADAEEKLQTAYQNMNLSARSLNSILKVSRTIADLDESKEVKASHVLEAIQYRRVDVMSQKFY